VLFLLKKRKSQGGGREERFRMENKLIINCPLVEKRKKQNMERK
jgi:hypothetical protein